MKLDKFIAEFDDAEHDAALCVSFIDPVWRDAVKFPRGASPKDVAEGLILFAKRIERKGGD